MQIPEHEASLLLHLDSHPAFVMLPWAGLNHGREDIWNALLLDHFTQLSRSCLLRDLVIKSPAKIYDVAVEFILDSFQLLNRF